MIPLKHKRSLLPFQNSLKCLLVWCVIAWCLFGLLLQGNVKTFIHSSRLRFLPSNGSGESSQEEMLPTFDLDCTFTKKRAHTDIKMAGHSIDFYGSDGKRLNNTKSEDSERSANNTNRRPLKVFVLLHSHVDPGWLRTFDQYYDEYVKAILTKAVYYLDKDSSLRFIWSEISYLEVWWQAATIQQKTNLLKLIKSGQFEITGGAWVMTDEATPYYWASIDNMIEGHQFLADELGVLPKTSWSVDPFGHGVMMPYLLRLSGVEKMAIGRINSAQKEKLRQNKQLVFRWRQMWDEKGVTDNWVHMLPRTYYTTVDSCGPNTEICCRFDFGSSARSICGVRAVVNKDTVNDLAIILADQYRKLGNYYRTNTVLVVVGDDFFFSRDDDWLKTSDQYSALFQHINGNRDKFGMQVQFGTLSEYFAELGQAEDYPTLSGDFFPYMDAPGKQAYWTGFFTTRPYFKRLERIIESRLRGTDLLSAFSLHANDWHKTKKPRRDLALFQHHDAITGTSTIAVMNDYLDRLLKSLTEMMKQQTKLASSVLSAKVGNGQSVSLNQTDNIPKGPDRLSSVPLTIATNGRIAIVVYNQLARQYTRIVRVVVRVPTIKVVRKNDRATIPAQINPVIVHGAILPDLYELMFLADLDSLSLTTFELQNNGQQPESTKIAKIAIGGRYSTVPQSPHAFFEFQSFGPHPIVLQNDYLAIGFDNRTGCLQFVKSTERQKESPLEMSFWTYSDIGGAYTFTPNEAPKSLDLNATLITVIRGPIMSAVHAAFSPLLQQTVAVYKAAGALGQGIHVTLQPNMTKHDQAKTSVSLVTRIKTQASLGHTFYTDVNGLHLMERTHDKTLPIQANYYPVGSAAVIQNRFTRVTLLSGQPMGAASEMAGSLEVMVDRTVANDDGKGLWYGQASDSPPSELQYTLLFEPRNAPEREERSVAYHSLIAQQALEQLFHPPTVFLANATADLSPSLSLAPALPCDVELLNVRPLSDGSLLLLLRRLTFDCAANGSGAQCANNQDSMQALIDALDAKTIEETTLTGTKTLRNLTSGAEILAQLGPMDLKAYRVRR